MEMNSKVASRFPSGQAKSDCIQDNHERLKEDIERKRLKKEREGILLWKRPVTTIDYGTRELLINVRQWITSLSKHWTLFLLSLTIIGIGLYLRDLEGPYKEKIARIENYLMWLSWWVGLGVLSSVGLGTGLHTFILYLGPHIAAVTLAAYECGTTEFPEPPYPSSIVCPDEHNSTNSLISIWEIVSKVRVEAFCWGIGTALGELPPYFMARAHRLSGHDPGDDDEEDEFLELQEKLDHHEKLSGFDRAKLAVERLVERLGFFGILACASIPNPLFDLAGITCGHFLVPFWTFFGATVIGKAVIKMHIQKMFIIIACNESLVESVVSHLHQIPFVGAKLETPFKELLTKHKLRLHRKIGSPSNVDPGFLGTLFEKLVLLMVSYFLISILNSLAQSYHRRIHKKKDCTKLKEQ